MILCGVGGQGILSIATIIGEAATLSGVRLKQAEVHGMSQRGGDVESDLRLSTSEIASDLIPTGVADIIISMEPMEALRHLGRLGSDGWVITSSSPFVNIPNYPDEGELMGELAALPHLKTADIEQLAKDNGIARSANVILLGMAAERIEILSKESLREAIKRVFAAKGEAVQEANLRAFEIGLEQ